jgi:hypothetical protein
MRPRSIISWEYIKQIFDTMLCARGMTWIQKRLKEKDTETIEKLEGTATQATRTTMTPKIPPGASNRNKTRSGMGMTIETIYKKKIGLAVECVRLWREMPGLA